MARKKSNNEQGVSMDSLMDALTNVVAVLIVILILLQIDVRQTVERMLRELEPATPEQVVSAQNEQRNLLEKLVKQKELLQAPEPTPQILGKIKTDISLLEESFKSHKAELLELEELKKRLETHKITESQERTKTETILTEIARIKALLDQTPVPKPQEATVIKIPNSREIPESAQIYYCYIFKDQAHLIDSVQARKLVMDEIKVHDRQLLRELVKPKKGASMPIYDQEKVVKHFAERNLKIREYLITVPYNKPGKQLPMRIKFDLNKGDATLADMEQPKGRFHNMCNYVRAVPRSVLFFRVHPNGFATYLKAREIADTMKIPCGWEISFSPDHYETLDFRVNNLEERPPQTTSPAPVPKLKRTLD